MKRLLLVFAATLGCAAVAQNHPADKPRVEGDVSELDIQGMTVLVKRLPHQVVTSCQLFIRGGAHNWSSENAGIEKLALETAVSGGTARLPKSDFQEQLAELGTQFGAESSEDHSELGFKSLDRNFAASFELMADAFLQPALPEAEIEQQRELMLSDLRQEEENPDGALFKALQAEFYRGLPYGNPAPGTLETLPKLTRDQLQRHLAGLRETSRLLLVVVGDVQPSEVAELVRAKFGSLPRGHVVRQAFLGPTFRAPHALLIDRPLPTHYLVEAFPAPTWGDPDFALGIVAMNALREKLFEEVRTKRELSYAPSAGLSARALGQGYLYVTAVDVQKTLAVMLSVVRDYQSGKIDPERLEGDKRIFLTNFLLQNETTSGQGDLLGSAELLGGDWRLAADLPAKVRGIRLEQVADFLSRHLRNLQVIDLGKSAGLTPQMFEGL